MESPLASELEHLLRGVDASGVQGRYVFSVWDCVGRQCNMILLFAQPVFVFLSERKFNSRKRRLWRLALGMKKRSGALAWDLSGRQSTL
jgi:hypothetical protein